jgi:hypothetical protein
MRTCFEGLMTDPLSLTEDQKFKCQQYWCSGSSLSCNHGLSNIPISMWKKPERSEYIDKILRGRKLMITVQNGRKGSWSVLRRICFHPNDENLRWNKKWKLKLEEPKQRSCLRILHELMKRQIVTKLLMN